MLPQLKRIRHTLPGTLKFTYIHYTHLRTPHTPMHLPLPPLHTPTGPHITLHTYIHPTRYTHMHHTHTLNPTAFYTQYSTHIPTLSPTHTKKKKRKEKKSLLLSSDLSSWGAQTLQRRLLPSPAWRLKDRLTVLLGASGDERVGVCVCVGLSQHSSLFA